MLLWRGDGPIARYLNTQEENLTQIKAEYLIALCGIKTHDLCVLQVQDSKLSGPSMAVAGQISL